MKKQTEKIDWDGYFWGLHAIQWVVVFLAIMFFFWLGREGGTSEAYDYVIKNCTVVNHEMACKSDSYHDIK